MSRYEITISRYAGDKEVCKGNWKDLISALVLSGYEVYGNNEEIIFKLGYDDKIKEVEENNG